MRPCQAVVLGILGDTEAGEGGRGRGEGKKPILETLLKEDIANKRQKKGKRDDKSTRFFEGCPSPSESPGELVRNTEPWVQGTPTESWRRPRSLNFFKFFSIFIYF